MPKSKKSTRKLPIGAELTPEGAHFRLWAPRCQSVSLVLLTRDGQSEREVFPMQAEDAGYYSALVAEASAGDLYGFSLDDHKHIVPDPASRFQPRGVHGPSQLVDSSYDWTAKD